ncbi:MAG: coproporphyrinogen III oxidase, partial [Alphaproteobacteria bacterium]|nr:coproporphyrinogen III oxidase [Alphaproteobacteria bacterium]
MTEPTVAYDPLAIYVHWPFCVSKCPYCDFNSHVQKRVDEAVWRDHYRREIAYYAGLMPGRPVSSIFFGGGTPSLMQPETVGAVLQAIHDAWPVATNAEITLEANPNSAEAARFAGFRAAGVNRVSVGVQALNDADLAFLGRAHKADEARAAIKLAARHFPRFSFDLIYARRGQSIPDWQRELTDALTMTGDHLSLYQLTIEPNTQFFVRAAKGEVLTTPDDEAVTLYEMTQDMMRAAGLPAYEISNHARPGDESRHNLTYWHYGDYLGIGPGAHGRYVLDGVRFATENARAPDAWLRAVGDNEHGVTKPVVIDTETAHDEA